MVAYEDTTGCDIVGIDRVINLSHGYFVFDIAVFNFRRLDICLEYIFVFYVACIDRKSVV